MNIHLAFRKNCGTRVTVDSRIIETLIVDDERIARHLHPCHRQPDRQGGFVQFSIEVQQHALPATRTLIA
jgi:hypothetical protein